MGKKGRVLKKLSAFAIALLLAVPFITPFAAAADANADIAFECSGSVPEKLIPLGIPIGIKLYSDGVVVTGISEVRCSDGQKVSPAADAGIKAGDIITSIDGKHVSTNDELQSVIKKSAGKKVKVSVMRGNRDISLNIEPRMSETDGAARIGIWVRDSMAGIGTVSFADPETGEFGALGHAICDTDSGVIMPFREGSIVGATVTDVKKGKEGEPGELHGEFDTSHDIGSLTDNTVRGIFGMFAEKDLLDSAAAMPVASSDEIEDGPAQIISTVNGGVPEKYDIKIEKRRGGEEGRNLLVQVTDKKLIKTTGGIVQGMSGSPIIQNGKLIGAVTHVLVNDPTKGFAISIDEMIAEKNRSQAAA